MEKIFFENDNTKIYNCDNLFLLNQLPSNSIDLIYSDILFNTGKTFPDYSDNLGSPEDAMLWYAPRINEMKRVLKDTGNLYLHCDYHLSHYLKVELDKIFGLNNFINEIIWWYNSAPRKKKHFAERHQTIFRYAKTKDYYFDDECEDIRVEYSPSAPRGYEKEHYYNPKGKVMDDVWRIWMLGQNDKTERLGYSSQKPKALLYPIIKSSCPKNGTVADFFMGSGTTAEVCNEIGLNFIGCDISQKANDITKKRLIKLYKGEINE